MFCDTSDMTSNAIVAINVHAKFECQSAILLQFPQLVQIQMHFIRLDELFYFAN